MVKNKKIISFTLFVIVIFIQACSGTKSNINADLKKKYDKGITLFNKKKYPRAIEQFKYIIMNNPGSRISIDSQFYLAESKFYNKDYIESSSEYTLFIRWSTDLEKIEEAKYKIASCAVNSVNDFQKDQTETLAALNLLQEFIDEYPNSNRIYECEKLVDELRDKLAKKDYETARLYLKLEKYDSAVIYFNQVINEFYDTIFYEKSHIGVLLSYQLSENDSLFSSYYKQNINQITLPENLKIAKQLNDGSINKFQQIKLLYR
tara:strand:+ start:367 stop:1152 length:786 start_codon:yes stop_codon:yes gene_type:complete